MKMLMILFRSSLEEEVRGFLKQLEVTRFTQVPEVFGKGRTGTVFNTFFYPGSNSMMLVAVDEAQAGSFLAELKTFHARLVAEQHGGEVPFHVFVLPCEQAV